MYIKGYITCNNMNQASYMKASLKSLILIQNLHCYNLRLFKAFVLIMCGMIRDEYVFNSMYSNV